MRIITFTVLIIALLAPSISAAQTPDTDQIDTFVRERLSDNNVPGAAWAIIRDGKMVHTATHGDDITADTRFVIGSVSKSHTATGVMVLVDQGKLSLDTPLSQALPDLKFADDRAGTITINHLLNHTAGFSEADGLSLSESSDFDSDGIAAAAEKTATFSLAFDPGSKHEYSDANYALLAAVIERASGRPFAAFMTDNVWKPLGMSHTGVQDDDTLATGHHYLFGQPNATDTSTNPAGAPYGFITSSIGDMSRWTEFQLGDGSPILKPESLRAMHTGSAEAYEGTRYGFGWRDSAATDDHSRRVWHAGANPDFGAFVGLQPDSKTGFVLLQNVYSPLKDADLTSIGFGALDLLDGKEPQTGGSGFMYPAVLGGLGVLTLAGLASLVVTIARRRSLRMPVTIAQLIASAAILWALLVYVPSLLGGSLSLARQWAPDVYWLILAAAISLGLAALARIGGHVAGKSRT